MSAEGHEVSRTPRQISSRLAERIRQIALAREMLALEILPKDMAGTVDLALDHLAFVKADLQHELDVFNRKYGIDQGPLPRGQR